MRCQFLDGGVIVCGGRQRLPNCSTPGCRGKGELSCDHPVKREGKPKKGDARVHREHKVIFYVIGVDEPRVQLTVSMKRFGGILQTVSIADWLAKSDATCDRPVCSTCAVRVGSLDYCPAHARAKESNV